MRKKHFVSSFSYPREKEPIMEAADTIAKRENISLSTFIMNVIESYVKSHSAGNPSFELNQWIEQPEFIGDPALREANDKWDRYLASCDTKDLQTLMGVFQKRLQQTNQTWRKKKHFTK